MVYCTIVGFSATLPEAKNTGLGNSLFQIAAAIGLSEENSDITIFSDYWKYNEYFVIGISTDNPNNFNITLEYTEPEFTYNKIPYRNGINLRQGYYQSEKYFKHCKDKIREIFTLKKKYENELKDKWNDKLKNSVSIHVRRGDYLDNARIGGILYCPQIEYYIRSLQYIESLTKIDNILVFSDDMQWCKENFKNRKCIFVENQKDIFDMFLMSYCNHNITANSSFSWWASWLNKNPDKVVTVPSIWFNPEHLYMKSEDLYRNEMIRI
jgi:hypothetical protein